MNPSDDGGTLTANVTKPVLFFLLFFLACHKPSRLPAPVPAPPALVKAAQSPPVAKAKKRKKKKLYLTFDDGPNRGTRNVLHIAQDEQVPVTFFIVGEHVFASVGQHRMWDSLRMAEQIAICNHSYSHAHSRYEAYYSDPDSVVRDFRRTQDSLDLTNGIVRTPGRNIWRIDSLQFTDLKKSRAAADSLQKAGFVVMGWDLEWPFDHKTMSVTITAEKLIGEIDSIFKHRKTKNPDHLVLLAHDQAYVKSADSFQLRQLLQLLKARDEYELSVATDYPGAVPLLADSARNRPN